MLRPIAMLSVLLLLGASPGEEQKQDGSKTPAQQYKALLEEFEEEGGTRRFAARFLELAEKHPEDPSAVDALVWILEKRRTQAEAVRAIELLREHHLRSEKLGEACRHIARTPTTEAEPMLRIVMESSPHASVRAHACLYLSDLLEEEARIVDQLKDSPELAGRVVQYYGKEYGKHLVSLDREKLREKLEKVYERMLASFPDASIRGQPMVGLAQRSLFRMRRLSVGCVAPEIEGEDISGTEFKLSDYRGKVVMLSFWGFW